MLPQLILTVFILTSYHELRVEYSNNLHNLTETEGIEPSLTGLEPVALSTELRL